jgi:hypothetical protein
VLCCKIALIRGAVKSLVFLWLDKRRELDDKTTSNAALTKLIDFLKQLAVSLGEHSPFEADLEKIRKTADLKLRFYAGGAGRYRLAKLFAAKTKVAGVVNVSSLYENTANILKIIYRGSEEEIGKPVLELQFDHNLHSLNQELLETFIRHSHIC